MLGLGTKNTSSRSKSDGPAQIGAGLTIGSALRERRDALGATLAEVEAATKIRQKYLSALEADEWQSLPGEVVGRGFLRNYAAYLGLEPTDIIEQRRSLADPSLAGALAVTSEGAEMPPMRAVDYRPKDVDLREEPASLEERQAPRLGPSLGVAAALALLILAGWGLTRYGGNILDGASAAYAIVADSARELFDNEALPTPTPSLAVAAESQPEPGTMNESIQPSLVAAPADTAGEGADGASLATDPSGDAAAGAALPADVVPTATQVAEPTPSPVPPTPTPEPATPTPTLAPQPATIATQANLRAAPSLEAQIIGGTNVGDTINIVGRTSDAQWFLLDSGGWIFAQLVTGAPAEVPIADPTPGAEAVVVALPTATPQAAAPTDPAATLPTEAPTEAPTIAEVPVAAPIVSASCADPRSVITVPGAGEVVSGQVPIVGNATHEAFASYKIEAGPPDGGLSFIGSGNTQVSGGTLGTLNSALFANGPLLVRLTVIDQTGNFPPPCDLAVTVQN